MNQNKLRQGFGQASGKIILFGEHSVVYGKPAIAIPVNDLKTSVYITENSANTIRIYAKNIGLDTSLKDLSLNHPIRKAIELCLIEMKNQNASFNLTIDSMIPVASGLGSGAAVSVSIARALKHYFEYDLSLEKINNIAFEIEKIYHGTPSGIDNTTITYESPIFYQKERPIEIIKNNIDYNFVIANSGIQASTKDIVLGVRNRFEKNRIEYQSIFNSIGELCIKAKDAIKHGQTKKIGHLMNKNQVYLNKIGVSSNKLESLIDAANKAGAMGAKISGAGVGGNIIAITNNNSIDEVSNALSLAGASEVYQTRLEKTLGDFNEF